MQVRLCRPCGERFCGERFYYMKTILMRLVVFPLLAVPLAGQTASPPAAKQPAKPASPAASRSSALPAAISVIKESDLKRDLYAMADDSMRGREAGTVDEMRASMWLADKFRAMGVAPKGLDGTYFQWWNMQRTRVSTVSSSVTLDGRPLALWTEITPTANLSGDASAPTVFVGDGRDTTVDVTGKIAVVIMQPPTAALRTTTNSYEYRYARAGITAAGAALVRRGAAGAIVVADSIADIAYDGVWKIQERGTYDVPDGVPRNAPTATPARAPRLNGPPVLFVHRLAGACLIESLTRIPADAETAAEFRYRNPVIEPATLYIAISQSGETFDTLAAVQEIKRKGGSVLGVINTPGSTIARECGSGIYLHAGPEVSVTSTKTFTSTVAAFALLALHLGRIRDVGPADGIRLVRALEALPGQIAEVLAGEDAIAATAARLATASSAFYVGRVRGYHVALEGAQKLKEISYIHAEAYPAAELKHGPLALVSDTIPTVVIVPADHLLDKNLATVAEIQARNGPVVVVTNSPVPIPGADTTLRVPATEPELQPILLGIPLQLLAYHAALALGRDIDKPRNLAKSVTVE